MTHVIVKDADGRQVATVHFEQGRRVSVNTTVPEVERNITQALTQGQGRGLPYNFYHRAKTESGVRYQSLARWVKPGDTDFPQALADYLIKYDYCAYPEEEAVRARPTRSKAKVRV